MACYGGESMEGRNGQKSLTTQSGSQDLEFSGSPKDSCGMQWHRSGRCHPADQTEAFENSEKESEDNTDS